jgi:leucyl-tRNA synthetase
MNALGRFDDRSPRGRAVMQEALEIVVLVLSPVAPHACHALWRELGHATPVIDARWPVADESAMQRSHIEVVLQVNGKLRARVNVPGDAAREELERVALADEHVRRFIDGKTVRKIIVVPGKLVNVVAG